MTITSHVFLSLLLATSVRACLPGLGLPGLGGGGGGACCPAAQPSCSNPCAAGAPAPAPYAPAPSYAVPPAPAPFIPQPQPAPLPFSQPSSFGSLGAQPSGGLAIGSAQGGYAQSFQSGPAPSFQQPGLGLGLGGFGPSASLGQHAVYATGAGGSFAAQNAPVNYGNAGQVASAQSSYANAGQETGPAPSGAVQPLPLFGQPVPVESGYAAEARIAQPSGHQNLPIIAPVLQRPVRPTSASVGPSQTAYGDDTVVPKRVKPVKVTQPKVVVQASSEEVAPALPSPAEVDTVILRPTRPIVHPAAADSSEEVHVVPTVPSPLRVVPTKATPSAPVQVAPSLPLPAVELPLVPVQSIPGPVSSHIPVAPSVPATPSVPEPIAPAVHVQPAPVPNVVETFFETPAPVAPSVPQTPEVVETAGADYDNVLEQAIATEVKNTDANAVQVKAEESSESESSEEVEEVTTTTVRSNLDFKQTAIDSAGPAVDTSRGEDYDHELEQSVETDTQGQTPVEDRLEVPQPAEIVSQPAPAASTFTIPSQPSSSSVPLTPQVDTSVAISPGAEHTSASSTSASSVAVPSVPDAPSASTAESASSVQSVPSASSEPSASAPEPVSAPVQPSTHVDQSGFIPTSDGAFTEVSSGNSLSSSKYVAPSDLQTVDTSATSSVAETPILDISAESHDVSAEEPATSFEPDGTVVAETDHVAEVAPAVQTETAPVVLPAEVSPVAPADRYPVAPAEHTATGSQPESAVVSTSESVAPSAPEVVPSASEVAPSAPEVAPTASEVAPTVPEVAPTAPESVPLTPEVAPSVPEVVETVVEQEVTETEKTSPSEVAVTEKTIDVTGNGYDSKIKKVRGAETVAVESPISLEDNVYRRRFYLTK